LIAVGWVCVGSCGELRGQAEAGCLGERLSGCVWGGLWWLREPVQAAEGVEERLAPGPAAWEVEAQAAGVVG
jgi:hypothetical protein